jgi:drug/metabolite transporter (DMT)-like permease
VSAELLGSIAGLGAALAWAANGLLIRAHSAAMHAVTINALRCTVAGVAFLVAWPFVSDRAPIPPLAWLFLGASMIVGLGIGDSLYFEAIKRIGVARAMPISMGYPVLAALGAVVVLHEPLGPLALAGMVLTLGGVYLVAMPKRATSSPAHSVDGYRRGVLLAAIAALGWSVSTLLLRPTLELVDVPTASAIRVPLVAALLWMFAMRGRVLPARRHLHGRGLVAILATGAVTVAATLLFLQSVALAGAGRAAVLTATSPLFGVPVSVWLLGEPGSSRLAVGTGCSVIGVALLALS